MQNYTLAAIFAISLLFLGLPKLHSAEIGLEVEPTGCPIVLPLSMIEEALHLEERARLGIDSDLAYVGLAVAYEFLGKSTERERALASAFLQNPMIMECFPDPSATTPKALSFLDIRDGSLEPRFLSYGSPENWHYETMDAIAEDYRALIDAHLENGHYHAAAHVEQAFAVGALNLLEHFTLAKRPEEMLKVLSTWQEVQRASEMEPAVRADFYKSLMYAYHWLDEHVLTVDNLAKLVAMEDIPRPVIESYLSCTLVRVFRSISWDLETAELRQRDSADFLGHFFYVRGDADLFDRIAPANSSHVVQSGREGEDAVYALPYGMVSREEDRVTINLCRWNAEDGLRSLRSNHLNYEACQGVATPAGLTYNGILAWRLAGRNFELPVKDLLLGLIDALTYDQAVEEVVPQEKIERTESAILAAISDLDGEEIEITTLEGFEVAKQAWYILEKLQE